MKSEHLVPMYFLITKHVLKYKGSLTQPKMFFFFSNFPKSVQQWVYVETCQFYGQLWNGFLRPVRYLWFSNTRKKFEINSRSRCTAIIDTMWVSAQRLIPTFSFISQKILSIILHLKKSILLYLAWAFGF